MKKTISLILLSSLLLLWGCAEQSTTKKDEPIKYTIYSDVLALSGGTDSGEQSATATQGTQANFESAKVLDVEHTNRTMVENTNAVANRTIKVLGVNEELSHRYSRASGLYTAANEEMKLYGLEERYELRDEDDNVNCTAFFRPNGELIYFLDFNTDKTGSETITFAQAQKLATQLLIELYGKEDAAKYVEDTVALYGESATDGLTVHFTRYIADYPTLDTVQIKFSPYGDLLGLNAMQHGIFSPLESQITAQRIQAAKDHLSQTVGFEIDETKVSLAVGADGKCYLQVYRDFETVYYINIA